MIYTIGYGNTDISVFIERLQDLGITTLVDVRSSPRSRLNPNFNQKRLIEKLNEEGIEYIWMGKTLGGFGDTPDDIFLRGIDKLLEIEKTSTIIVMCSEKDYHKCHRYYKITPKLIENEMRVKHIVINTKKTKGRVNQTRLVC